MWSDEIYQQAMWFCRAQPFLVQSFLLLKYANYLDKLKNIYYPDSSVSLLHA